MKILRNFIIIFFCFQFYFAKAQNESNIWYFGSYVGLDFSTGSPVVLTQGLLNTTEGVATLCDKNGKLLFYTDGLTVWNREHKVMNNGDNLKGNASSTQSAVAVPKPGSENLFYLFTIAREATDDGFCYSIVDMAAEGGMGKIVEKNKLLLTPVTEKITAVRHRNNKDVWILTHGWNNNEFLAYLLTENGLNENPIKTNIGKVHGNDTDNSIGYMKSSPDGSQLAVAVKGLDLVELFDFDNATGVFSNPLTFEFAAGALTYGVEFSPNGSFLYVTCGSENKVYQFNLQAGSDEAIKASKYELAKTNGWAGALQLAKDGKIYVSPYNSKYLDVIENPDAPGTECRYVKEKIDLLGKYCQLGFPTFLQSYFTKQVYEEKVNYFSEYTAANAKKKVEVNKNYILKSVVFETAKSILLPTAYKELDLLINILKTNPTYVVEINGHTDNVGNKTYNLKLSQERAASAMNYLKTKGIALERMSAYGFGNSKPIASNETEAGRQENRRVDFILKEKK